MAPLFMPCSKISTVYSPWSNRSGHSLPGYQSRVVPFVRPATRPSRAERVSVLPDPLSRRERRRPSGLPGSVAACAQIEEHQRDHSEIQDLVSIGSLAVHGGERAGRPRVSDSLITPIVQTATYTFRDTAELIAYQEGRFGSYEYGRYGNPTTRACEEKIRALEGAEDALVSSSGMCAATTTLLALVPAGGHVVTTTDCYRRTRQFIQTVLPKMGIAASVVDPADLEGLARALRGEGPTSVGGRPGPPAGRPASLFFSESPTNPFLRCVDVARTSAMAREVGAVSAIDSTFATPINQRALSLGADVVLHSATKYLSGHNDVLAGAVAGRADLVAAVRALHNVLGGTVDPHAAYLLLRGMKTLDVRVRRSNETAALIAARLERHPAVARCYYPGLPSHPDHETAKRQMTAGYGGVVSFEVQGGLEDAAAVVDGVRLPYIAPSLGGVETLIEQPTVISYWDQPKEVRRALGISDALIRYSCGVEDAEDLWKDLEQSLDRMLVKKERGELKALVHNA